MILLALTLLTGRRIHVTFCPGMAIEESDPMAGLGTRVWLPGGMGFEVKETPQEIMEQMQRVAARMQLAGATVAGRG